MEQRAVVEVKLNDQTQDMKSLLTVMVGELPRPRLSERDPGSVSPDSQPHLTGTNDILAPVVEGGVLRSGGRSVFSRGSGSGGGGRNDAIRTERRPKKSS